MDLEQKAIERLKTASQMSLKYYNKPLVCTYSGGKDSDVMLELFKRSGIPFEANNSHTTVDAPQTVYHIRDKFRELELNGIKADITKAKYKGKTATMWNLIPAKKIPPTRTTRYCCEVLKETGCKNRFIATGVRWDESSARSEREAYETIASSKKNKIGITDEIMLMNDNSDKRKMTEHCMKKNKMVVNPIIDWEHNDIWEFIRSEKMTYNPLYDCGYKRVGCIGCPMAGKKDTKNLQIFQNIKQRIFMRLTGCYRKFGPQEKKQGGKPEKKFFFGGWRTRI